MTCLYLLTGKDPLQFTIDPHTCELVWENETILVGIGRGDSAT